MRDKSLDKPDYAYFACRRARGARKISAAVRDAWWNWQRARGEQLLARERLISAQKLADDVRRRTKAGDLARSDQHQADGAAASAEVALAESASLLAAATQQLRALIRQARKDAKPEKPGEALRHGRAYRDIFQIVREQLMQGYDVPDAQADSSELPHNPGTDA